DVWCERCQSYHSKLPIRNDEAPESDDIPPSVPSFIRAMFGGGRPGTDTGAPNSDAPGAPEVITLEGEDARRVLSNILGGSSPFGGSTRPTRPTRSNDERLDTLTKLMMLAKLKDRLQNLQNPGGPSSNNSSGSNWTNTNTKAGYINQVAEFFATNL